MKKQPKPVTAWTWLNKGKIDTDWITFDAEEAAAWRSERRAVCELRLAPVASKKKARKVTK